MRVLNIVLILIVTGCGDPPPSQYPSQELHAEDATLGPGDTFEVRVYRQEDLSGTYAVSAEGTISFPLIGTVEVQGKAPSEVERILHDRLADGFLREPSVSVLVKESKSKNISVVGQVVEPQTLAFAGGMTLIDAIAKAGGFTPMAQKNAVSVTRTADGKKVRYTIPAQDIGKGRAENFFVRPGDVVFVPRRAW